MTLVLPGILVDFYLADAARETISRFVSKVGVDGVDI